MKTKPLQTGAMKALIDRFGYTVTITPKSLDTPLPVFHRYNAQHVGGHGPDDVALPVVHAATFSVPCTTCFPETTDPL